ncbi:MAG TPA: hypothetical protein VME45_03305 [Stellaceae bacterium]|nr:hypothetical protein [Stellaceae bacterium]
MSAPIERIFVILDAAAETSAAIAAAVRLAARSKTPLHAVFVEEEDLLSVAGLSVARHIVPGARSARLTGAEVELHWRAAAARARDDLMAAARAQMLRCSFEVVRGAAETVLAGVAKGDLVVAGARTRPFAGHLRVRSRWLAVLEAASGPFLLAQDGHGTKGGIVVLLRERSADSARLLQAAARLAEPGATPLTVIAPPALATARSFQKWIADQVEPGGVQPTIEAAPAATTALLHRVRELDCRVLAIDAATTERDRLAEITERFACDILVVR